MSGLLLFKMTSSIPGSKSVPKKDPTNNFYLCYEFQLNDLNNSKKNSFDHFVKIFWKWCTLEFCQSKGTFSKEFQFYSFDGTLPTFLYRILSLFRNIFIWSKNYRNGIGKPIKSSFWRKIFNPENGDRWKLFHYRDCFIGERLYKSEYWGSKYNHK